MSKWNPLRRVHGVSRNAPISFIENAIEGIPRPTSVDPPLQYSSEVDLFVQHERKAELVKQQDSAFSLANDDLENLCHDIIVYQDKINPETRLLVDIRRKDSRWLEVQGLVKTHISREAVGSEEYSRVRRSCSKIVQYLPAFQGWLDMLPDDAYGSVISGAFKLIIGAVQRAAEVRARLLEGLAEIPERITLAERYRDLYADRAPEKLANKTAELCSAIIYALRLMVVHLAENKISTSVGPYPGRCLAIVDVSAEIPSTESAVKALFQGPCYQKDLTDQLDLIKDITHKLDHEAGVLSQYRVQNIEATVQTLLEQNNELVRSVATGEALLNAVYAQLTSEARINAGRTSLSSPLVSGQESLRLQAPLAVIPTAINAINSHQLLSALQQKSGSREDDFTHCASSASAMDIKALDRLKWCMHSLKLRNFLKENLSSIFLINGNSDIEIITPLTILVWKLAQNILPMDKSRVIGLQYFCSFHRAPTAERPGVGGMLQSFIAQLLSQQPEWNLSFLNADMLKRLTSRDIESLCRCIDELLFQLPEATIIYWFIDGINYYERWPNTANLSKAMEELCILLQKHEHIVLKLLLSHPGRSKMLLKFLRKQDILEMPAEIDGDQQGWNNHSWNGLIDQALSPAQSDVVERE